MPHCSDVNLVSFFWLLTAHATLPTSGPFLENILLILALLAPRLDLSLLVGAEESFTFDLFVGLKNQNHRGDEMSVRGGAQGIEGDEVT